MPGTMFVQPATLAALPTTGTAWDRLAAASIADPGAGNLSALNQPHALAVFSIALRWAKDGGGLGRDYVIDEIKAAMGTETANGELYPYRAVGVYIMAADLVDMPGSTVGANGATFNAWVQAWPALLRSTAPVQYSTLYKAARVASHSWGAYARASLLAVSLWLIKEGLDPTGSGVPTTATALRDETIGYFKRWLGDTTVTNTLTAPSFYVSTWAVTSFPTSQGAINPVTSDATRNGADIVDASNSGGPPLTGGSGKKQVYEALDGVDVTTILAINAGYTDAAGWGDNAASRCYQWLIANGLTTEDSNYSTLFRQQPWFANYLWGLSFPTPTSALDPAQQQRMLTTHTDWLSSPGSTWLRATSESGGGSVVVSPHVSFTATVTDQTVDLDATGTTTGSSAIARHEVDWGDGSTTTLTEPTRTFSHLYDPPSGGATYTITVRAVATDGGQATAQQSVLVTDVAGAPVAQFTLDKTMIAAGEPVVYDFTGSFDPLGGDLTRTVDFGDGTVVTDAPEIGTYTYEDPDDTASYTVTALVEASALTSSPVTRTVSVAAATSAKQYAELFLGGDTAWMPVLPAFDSAWNGFHIKLGAFRIWADATGTLRVKNGAPTSDLDGSPLGSGAGFVVVNAGDPPPPGTAAGTIVFEI